MSDFLSRVLLMGLLPLGFGLLARPAERWLPLGWRTKGAVELTAALGLSLGFVLGFGLLFGLTLAPRGPGEVIPWAVILGAILAWSDVRFHDPKAHSERIRAIAPAAAAVALTIKLLPADTDNRLAVLITLTSASAIFLGWKALDRLAGWLLPALWALVVAIWVLGLALVLAQGNTVLSQGAAFVGTEALLTFGMGAVGLFLACFLNQATNPAVDAAAIPAALLCGAVLLGGWHGQAISLSGALTGLLIPAALVGLLGIPKVARMPETGRTALLFLSLLGALTLTAVLA